MRLAALALCGLVLSPAVLAQDGACTDGSASLDGVVYPCNRVDIVSNVGPSGVEGPFRAPQLNDIWGWTDPDNGDEYALVGTTRGVVFVDVSVPEAPRVLGKMLATGFDQGDYTTWRDIKVYQDHAFVVADGTNFVHGMQVLDLTTLRGLSEDPQRDIEPTTVYMPVFDAHNIVINEASGMAYAVGGSITPGMGIPTDCNAAGFHAIDISDPANPTFAGCFSDASQETGPRPRPGYTHDAQCIVYDGPDPDHQGKEICFGANEDVVSIFDATDPANAVLLSQTAYPQFSYTHQGWLTEDRRYFLANDELDESNSNITQRTLVLDVEDLDDPEYVFAYDSGLTTIDHNLYVLGDLAYEANYEAGLRILDLRQIAGGTLSEAAFFDTYPQSTDVSFTGAWSSYPYFASGNVIVSDRRNGLFVLRPDPELLVSNGETPDPVTTALSVPVPNPTTGSAALTLTVDTAQAVTVTVYDVSGRLVATLFDGGVPENVSLALTVDGSALPSGVYVVRARGEAFDVSRSLTLTR